MVAQNSPALTITLPSDREIAITRSFNAPREMVFNAYTNPEAIAHWWGPKGSTTVVDKMDVRVGGVWRFIEHAPDGSEHAFNGVYREINPHDRLVYTFEYEPMAGHILVEAINFEEQDGKTTLHYLATFDNIEDRDGMINSGMEGGMRESLERLDQYLADQQ